jgi:hypothetical protein
MVLSLLQSAKLHGHDPWTYLKDVLTRLPCHLNSRIKELQRMRRGKDRRRCSLRFMRLGMRKASLKQ